MAVGSGFAFRYFKFEFSCARNETQDAYQLGQICLFSSSGSIEPLLCDNLKDFKDTVQNRARTRQPTRAKRRQVQVEQNLEAQCALKEGKAMGAESGYPIIPPPPGRVRPLSPSTLIDGSNETHWRVGNEPEEYSAIVIEVKSPSPLQSYEFITSPSGPEFDPASWSVFGSVCGFTWTRLHTVEQLSPPVARCAPYPRCAIPLPSLSTSLRRSALARHRHVAALALALTGCLSGLDVVTDVAVVAQFLLQGHIAWALLLAAGVVAAALFSHIASLLTHSSSIANRGPGYHRVPLWPALIGMGPAYASFARIPLVLNSGDDDMDVTQRLAAVDGVGERRLQKFAEVVFEAIPAAILQSYILLASATPPTATQYASSALSLFSVARFYLTHSRDELRLRLPLLPPWAPAAVACETAVRVGALAVVAAAFRGWVFLFLLLCTLCLTLADQCLPEGGGRPQNLCSSFCANLLSPILFTRRGGGGSGRAAASLPTRVWLLSTLCFLAVALVMFPPHALLQAWPRALLGNLAAGTTYRWGIAGLVNLSPAAAVPRAVAVLSTGGACAVNATAVLLRAGLTPTATTTAAAVAAASAAAAPTAGAATAVAGAEAAAAVAAAARDAIIAATPPQCVATLSSHSGTAAAALLCVCLLWPIVLMLGLPAAATPPKLSSPPKPRRRKQRAEEKRAELGEEEEVEEEEAEEAIHPRDGEFGDAGEELGRVAPARGGGEQQGVRTHTVDVTPPPPPPPQQQQQQHQRAVEPDA